MDFNSYNKELLAFIASAIAGAGASIIMTKPWEGTALLLISAAVFIGRGFFKKYIEDARKPQ